MNWKKQLAEFSGVKHAIANSSGTDALLLPLMAWGGWAWWMPF